MKKSMFRCVICGYIHEGLNPPDECPICGATKENFEEDIPKIVDSETRNEDSTYRCLNCEYIHKGDIPPAKCPVCGFSAEHFEFVEAFVSSHNHPNIKKVVVLGGGIAAVSAIETLIKENNELDIVLITNEEKLPYFRLNLTRFLSDEVSEGDLCIHPQYWYDENNIKVVKNRMIIDILPKEKKVLLADNLEYEYDRLIITLGAHPFIPPISGVSAPGVLTLRSVLDAKDLINTLDKSKKVLVIGGGVLGLETAGALAGKGIPVTVAEGARWLMPRQLNAKAGSYVEKSLAKLGVSVEYDFRTIDIKKNDDNSFDVIASDGRSLSVNMVIVATGVRPNTYLARKAGLEVDKGLVVDNYMRTSDDNIYAAGDITEHYGITYGLWNIAQYQGKIAALNLLGNKVPFGGVPSSNALKVLDIDLFSIGDINLPDASYIGLERSDEDSYLYMIVRDQQLVGSIAIGYKNVTHRIKHLVEKGQRLTPEQLSDISYLVDMLES